ncbi:hypothetical protein F5Y10DRAFT_264932 [Nemania abortiva]|nr:hypothetical protein F5Y10DRAFT_264932 [Nemania abortiva]
MPAITDLPCEIIASILRSLDNLRYLTPALLTCRHFYTSFRQYHDIEAAILRQHVTPALVPYAIAVIEASHLPDVQVEDSVRDLLDTLRDHRSRFAARLPTMPARQVRRMARTHDVIHSLATDFATIAWASLARKLGSESLSASSGNSPLSPSEYFRLCRAFYRLELYYRLFSRYTPVFVIEGMELYFFSQFSPWEMEQLVSVHDFLDEKLSNASYDVVAHDIEFGEVRTDYLAPARESYWKQIWLSQGVDFIHQLTTVDSYEAKRTLLNSALGRSATNLPERLEAMLETYSKDVLDAAEACSKDQLQSLLSSCDNDDTNNGPFEAWYTCHEGVPAGAWAMTDDNAWLRRRAYVFWDWGRIQSNDLLPVFRSVPESQSSAYTSQEYDEMLESFDERSRISQAGGRGYWSKGDTSRIKYN